MLSLFEALDIDDIPPDRTKSLVIHGQENVVKAAFADYNNHQFDVGSSSDEENIAPSVRIESQNPQTTVTPKSRRINTQAISQQDKMQLPKTTMIL